MASRHLPARTAITDLLYVFCVLAAADVVHGVGHLTAAVILGDRVGTWHLHVPVVGSTVGPRPAPRHRAYRCPQLRGEPLAPIGSAIFSAAGPAANLATAPLLLLLPLPRWQVAGLAVAAASPGVAALVPFQFRNGSSSDGLSLRQIRPRLRAEADLRRLRDIPGWTAQPGSADTLIAACGLGAQTAADCIQELTGNREGLLSLNGQAWRLPRWPMEGEIVAVYTLSYRLLMLEDLPPALADLAASRAEWMLGVLRRWPRRGGSRGRQRAIARHWLALARLRQGRPAEVEALCQTSPAVRIPVVGRAERLATVALARHALGQSGARELAEALALAPDRVIVRQAAAKIAPP